MNEHPIEELMKTTMDSIKDMIDVNTIVGDPVHTDSGTTILPISKVSIGFASGGSEFTSLDKNKMDNLAKYPFGGGSGAGMSLQPVAFLVVSGNDVRLLPLSQGGSIERLLDRVPEFLEDIMNSVKKSKGCSNQNSSNNNCSGQNNHNNGGNRESNQNKSNTKDSSNDENPS